MKRILIYILLPVFGLIACRKEEKIFSKTPDQRITDTLNAYQARLTGAPYGWIGLVYPRGGGAYAFYFSFGATGRVKMFSDFDSTSAGTEGESSYRLESLQQPCLNFDTYSYIHLLADPDGSVNGGADGVGLASDFEFAISDSSTADTIRLTGRFNGSKALLRKATQAEHDGYYNQGLASVWSDWSDVSKIPNYFKRLTTDNGAYDVSINSTAHTVTFTWLDENGNPQTFTTSWYATPTGIVLVQPFRDAGTTITSFTGIDWNATTATFSATGSGSTGNPATGVTIKGGTGPLVVDATAPQTWYQTALSTGTYWYSIQGFHSNGIDNAYKIDTVTARDSLNNILPYYYLLYIPGFQSASYDFFGPAFLLPDNTLTLDYGWANTYSVKTDGHGVFTLFGTFGTVPVNGAAYQTQQRLVSTGGYYFVRTSASTYDMVSKTDTKIWISWSLAQ